MSYDNSIPSYQSMLDFQEVYLRAVALVWADEYERGAESTFRQELCDDPMKFLQQKFAYNCPWNIDLYVHCPSEEANKSKKDQWPEYLEDDCRWIPGDDWTSLSKCSSDKKYKAGRWENLKQNTVVFGHPQKPGRKYKNSRALALAAYNDSGPGYLFTCC